MAENEQERAQERSDGLGASVLPENVEAISRPSDEVQVTCVDWRALPLGLYRVFWASGGQSLAAVGMGPSGERWIAPTNWQRPAMTDSLVGWGEIERMELVDPDAQAVTIGKLRGTLKAANILTEAGALDRTPAKRLRKLAKIIGNQRQELADLNALVTDQKGRIAYLERVCKRAGLEVTP